MAAALGVPGTQAAADDPEPAHALKLFFLFFNRAAFLTQTWDSEGRSFHAYARNEARRYEEAVSKDLGQRVFTEVYPRLAEALARGDLEARKRSTGYGSYTRQQFTPDYLDEVREATLVLLYRLLFMFYAEDRFLLPTRDERYAPYSVRGLRERVRDGMDGGRAWSSTMEKIWLDLRGVFHLINNGDDEIGMPAYNGGLFDRVRSPLLERTGVPDRVIAPIIDALSRRTEGAIDSGPAAWINYRDLSVSHLGGIYERLLEYSLVHEVQAAESYHDRPEIDRLIARPASFARKASGSYYTHDDLVRLILRESIGRLADERIARFEKSLADWKKRATLTPALWDKLDGTMDAAQRNAIDPATQILELTVCDPAMGSGHFLVALVDFLADRVLEATSLASALVNQQPWAAHLVERGRPWESPVIARIAHIRGTIREGAIAHKWSVTDAQLDDRHIVRRMILKKTIFGVDKNPMAVELAKTALWLHTFTVGAPLSFLDHHLKLGDSLHGERLPAVQQGLSRLGMLFNQGELDRLSLAARDLSQVADLTDVDIAEARESKRLANEADARTAPLHALLDFWRAMRWLLPGWPAADARKLSKLGDEKTRAALAELIAPGLKIVAVLAKGKLGDDEGGGDGTAGGTTGSKAGAAAAGVETAGAPSRAAANALIRSAQSLARRESFFHWWTAFPTVFHQDGSGGFDAVIGNPPWDRIKLQEVEWFAEREPRIATQARAADRKRLITELQAKKAPLAADYQHAVERAEANARVLSKAGDYPLLGGGDVNLYSLFVERAQALVQPEGIVAILTPSGIAADKGAMKFFAEVSTTGRLGALYDFENKRVYFADVDSRFKFMSLVFGGTQRRFDATGCAFYLHSLDELDKPGRVLTLTKEDFALVNPNTGAAPVFRGARDAAITTGIYRRHPVLVRHADANGAGVRRPERKTWPVKYATTFHMTNDSQHFIKAEELRPQGWQPAGAGRWRRGEAHAVPLYVGRMVHQFDHRHASVTVNDDNLHNAAGGALLGSVTKADPTASPTPQYWVPRAAVPQGQWRDWAIGFRDIARATDARTMIACIVPGVAAGNTLPLLLEEPSIRPAPACCWPT